MRRGWLAALAIAICLTACLPAPSYQTNALPPKAGSQSAAGTPPVGFTPLPTATIGPPAGANQLIPRTFPPPFSYGPRYDPPTPIPPPTTPQYFPPDAINVLLLGSDRRSGRSFRTDTIIVVSLQPSAHAAAMISIPRDLYVYLPGFNMQRVNAALTLGEEFGYPGGGRAMLADTLLYNLGIPIHYYAQVEMSGFQAIVDQVDGVDVNVACSYTDWRLEHPSLNPEVEDNWELFTVPSGVVHMDGDYALWYARSRARSSDFDRARRQQEVLRALHRQALRLDLIPQIPSLYNELIQSISTDLSLADLVRLAPLAVRIDPSRVRSRFIGRDQVTSWRTPTGGAVLLPKPEAIAHLLQETLDFESADPLVPEPSLLVEVVNGSSRDDLATLAAERLTYAGFETRLLRTGAAGSLTRVIDYGLADPSQRTNLLSALGLPASAVENGTSDGQAAFRLIVGDNFDPCFDPTRNQ
ncbi:MAG TPA: LCP family protein [Anaerolineales bacterium]|jgi:LCP family protein required for cell wall assembly